MTSGLRALNPERQTPSPYEELGFKPILKPEFYTLQLWSPFFRRSQDQERLEAASEARPPGRRGFGVLAA